MVLDLTILFLVQFACMAKRWCKDGKVEIKGQFFDLHKNTHIYVLTSYPLRQITDKILIYNNMNIHFLHKIERKTIFERTKKNIAHNEIILQMHAM